MLSVELPCRIVLTTKTVLSLAAAHIGHFSEMIECCPRGVNLAEARYYCQLWKDIRTAINHGRSLGSEQVQELYDACTSGDWDCYLTAAEFRMVHLAEARAS